MEFMRPRNSADVAPKHIGGYPDEYSEIIEENFAMSYPEKFLRNFRDFILEIAKAISKGESG